ncbi:MAG: SDR family oxidoreductase [Lachnospiraceae bacterium]|nr:SDR family oxidoreductase [Lachnospiraceae bacterium]
MNYKLRVSRVLVTGGGSGIGLAITKALLGEGCHVCICGRSIEKLNKAKEEIGSERLSVMQWDIRDVSIIREKINEAAALTGGYLDGLVNNAGVFLPHNDWKPWNETSEQWDSVWDTNLKAPMFLIRQFSTYLHQNNLKGNILCISSIESLRYEVLGSYTGSKYAYSRMIRSHAKQVLNLGIVINGINPGVTVSDIHPSPIYNGCEIKRAIKAEEIAECALFMMSEQAAICCGAMLNADGGYYNAI